MALSKPFGQFGPAFGGSTPAEIALRNQWNSTDEQGRRAIDQWLCAQSSKNRW